MPDKPEASYVIKLNGEVKDDGFIPLSVGSSVITVVVTAEDGVTSQTYTVTVTRQGVTDETPPLPPEEGGSPPSPPPPDESNPDPIVDTSLPQDDQQRSTVALEGISSSHDSVREDDGQATTITLTVTLARTAGFGGEKITLTIVSPKKNKWAKRDKDFVATLADILTIEAGHRTGTAQLTLTPKDNATADGDKAFGVLATSSSGHAALIDIKIIDDELADDQTAFGFAGEIEDQVYTAESPIAALQLPEATSGTGAVTYRVSGLPAGLLFDDSTRTISGTPVAATDGAVEVTYTAETSTGVAAMLTFSITVHPPLSFGDLFDLFN